MKNNVISDGSFLLIKL